MFAELFRLIHLEVDFQLWRRDRASANAHQLTAVDVFNRSLFIAGRESQ